MSKNLITKEHKERLQDFYDKIHEATLAGEEWVETSDEIIKHYNKNGLGKAEYFHFQNVKVCGYGQSERIQKELSRQLGELVHGDAKVQQVEKTRHQVTRGLT